MSVLHYF